MAQEDELKEVVFACVPCLGTTDAKIVSMVYPADPEEEGSSEPQGFQMMCKGCGIRGPIRVTQSDAVNGWNALMVLAQQGSQTLEEEAKKEKS